MKIIINGWLARDEDGSISFYNPKPIRKKHIFIGYRDEKISNLDNKYFLNFPKTLFSEVTWNNSPIRAKITVEVEDE